MMVIKYQIKNTLPFKMISQLKEAKTADIAEQVFIHYAELGGYVEPRSRAAVWLSV